MPVNLTCQQCGTSFQRSPAHAGPWCSNRCSGIAKRFNTDRDFWPRVEKTPTCWLWTGSVYKHSGYGFFNTNGRVHRVHRYSYILANGPIPDGCEIDHLCRVHNCVNPAHLEAVTHRINVLRGISPIAAHANQTHCKRGHPLEGENVILRRSDGGRQCRACMRESRPKHNLARRLARKRRNQAVI
jgi:hypothetical protein